jgi:CRISPR-associated DxTHG motif protein
VFDFTHGFRSVPIIFSTAIGFLQKAKRFTLLNAFYGYLSDPKTKIGELVDMANFYRINEWADGISQLVETADASKLARLAKSETQNSFQGLRDEKLIDALKDLTAIVKNIDVNRLSGTAENAISIIKEKIRDCNGADRQLLEMVLEKFGDLVSSCNPAGHYDSDYFRLQLRFIELLNRHELYMQSFTVIIETVGSIGMLGAPEAYQSYSQGGVQNNRVYADVFIQMLNVSNWAFPENKKKRVDELMPFYRILDQLKIEPTLRSIVTGTKGFRDGFAHAWTGFSDKKIKKYKNIGQTATETAARLKEIITRLEAEKIIPAAPESPGKGE